MALQERVYPETEVKLEGCDEQEDLKKRVWELEESDLPKLIAALEFHPQRLCRLDTPPKEASGH